MRRRFFGRFGSGAVVVPPPPPPPPPPPLLPPVKTGNPTISSPTLNVGDTATAVHGTYTGSIAGYSGQWYRGASPIALATALTYIFVSADLGLNITYQESASNSGGSSLTGTSNALGPIVSGPALATPTLTNFSALGAVPVVLSWSDTDYTVGLYGQLQVATDSGFSSITQNIVFFIDGDSWARLDEAIGLITPSGTYYARIRTARDNDSGATTVSGTDPSGASVSFLADVSAWSTTFTDFIGALAALNTTNGTNKDSLLTVTGTPALSFSGTAANGNNSVRSTLQQGFNKAQFEVTITSGAATGTTVVGIEDGTTNFNTTHGMPGLDGSGGVGSGIAVAFYASGSTVSIFHSAGGVEIDLINSAGTIANGDTFTIVYDKVNNTLEVHRTRSGVTVQIGSTQTGLPALSAQYAYCGTRSSTSAGTMNFGSTTYAKTPGTGVAAFWA